MLLAGLFPFTIETSADGVLLVTAALQIAAFIVWVPELRRQQRGYSLRLRAVENELSYFRGHFGLSAPPELPDTQGEP